MPDYQKGKIYKLVNSVSDDCYFGSTCQRLSDRKASHKKDYNKYVVNESKYVTSFKLFAEDPDGVDIILVENYPCNSKEELHRQERYYIENNKCLNKYVPLRTQTEYYHDNKDKIIANTKRYYHKNKTRCLERQKKYIEANKEVIKERKKKYREANKEKLNAINNRYYHENKIRYLEQQKKYREEKQGEINAKKREKIECVHCGKEVSSRNMARHKQTQHTD